MVDGRDGSVCAFAVPSRNSAVESSIVVDFSSLHLEVPVSVINDRDDWVSQAKHSALLEGLKVSQVFQSESDEYVAGTISSDELVEITRARFGLVRST